VTDPTQPIVPVVTHRGRLHIGIETMEVTQTVLVNPLARVMEVVNPGGFPPPTRIVKSAIPHVKRVTALLRQVVQVVIALEQLRIFTVTREVTQQEVVLVVVLVPTFAKMDIEFCQALIVRNVTHPVKHVQD